MKRADKENLKKLRARAKFHKKSSGRRKSLPPNKVVPDKKKVLDKKSGRIKVKLDDLPCRPDGGRDGSGFLM